MKRYLSRTVVVLIVTLLHSSKAFQQAHFLLQTPSGKRSPFVTRSSNNDDARDDENNQQEVPSVVPAPVRAVSQSKRLDPLLASLTRMDDETRNAKRISVPIWGELILDRSLMLLLPVGAFAILGLGTSIFVAINAKDAIIDTLLDATTDQVYLKGVSSPDYDPNICRGLCSSQQDDLEALGSYMKSISGAK
jgi:hypothetical protein